MTLTETEYRFYQLLRHLIKMSNCNCLKASHRHIAQIMRCTPTTSYRNIKRLRDKGLVIVERPGGRENFYRIPK